MLCGTRLSLDEVLEMGRRAFVPLGNDCAQQCPVRPMAMD